MDASRSLLLKQSYSLKVCARFWYLERVMITVGLSGKNKILSVDKAIIRYCVHCYYDTNFLPTWESKMRGFRQPLLFTGKVIRSRFCRLDLCIVL